MVMLSLVEQHIINSYIKLLNEYRIMIPILGRNTANSRHTAITPAFTTITCFKL